MTKNRKNKLYSNQSKGYATNTVTEIIKTESAALLPVSSDQSVEEARDWVNDGSKL